MKDFFTSDWHFNHANITGPRLSKWPSGYRTFSSIEEMNSTILEELNMKVNKNDNLYFLGDLCFGDHTLTPFWRKQIICDNIFWIKGNHDNHQFKYKDNFIWAGDVKQIKSNNQSIFLSHYKHFLWDKSHHGTWHLYGHSHASAEHWEIGKSMDVGIDNYYRLFGKYSPFEFSEIKEIMDLRIPQKIDHHDGAR